MSNQLRLNTWRFVFSSLLFITVISNYLYSVSHDAIKARGQYAPISLLLMHFLEDVQTKLINVIPIMGELFFHSLNTILRLPSFRNYFPFHKCGHKALQLHALYNCELHLDQAKNICVCDSMFESKMNCSTSEIHPADHSTIIFTGNLTLARSSHIFER